MRILPTLLLLLACTPAPTTPTPVATVATVPVTPACTEASVEVYDIPNDPPRFEEVDPTFGLSAEQMEAQMGRVGRCSRSDGPGLSGGRDAVRRRRDRRGARVHA